VDSATHPNPRPLPRLRRAIVPAVRARPLDTMATASMSEGSSIEAAEWHHLMTTAASPPPSIRFAPPPEWPRLDLTISASHPMAVWGLAGNHLLEFVTHLPLRRPELTAMSGGAVHRPSGFVGQTPRSQRDGRQGLRGWSSHPARAKTRGRETVSTSRTNSNESRSLRRHGHKRSEDRPHRAVHNGRSVSSLSALHDA
jgi:hypothetical protein